MADLSWRGAPEEQAANLIFPMGRLFGGGGFDSWAHDVLSIRGGATEDLYARSLRAFPQETLRHCYWDGH